MVKASPFIHQPGKASDVQQLIGDIKHTWKIRYFFSCVVTAFLRAGNPCINEFSLSNSSWIKTTGSQWYFRRPKRQSLNHMTCTSLLDRVDRTWMKVQRLEVCTAWLFTRNAVVSNLRNFQGFEVQFERSFRVCLSFRLSASENVHGEQFGHVFWNQASE